MTCPVILTDRDEDALVDVEWSGETLRKYVHDIIVAIGAVVKFNAERVLPFLCLQNVLYVGSMKDKALEIEFAHTAQFRSGLQIYVSVVTEAVIPFEKADLRIEIGTDLAMLAEDFEPAI